MESALTSKGQATIPKPVRDRLRLQPGDRIKFFFHPDGHVVILPKVRTSTLKEIVRSRLAKAPTLEEIEAGIAARMLQKHKRK